MAVKVAINGLGRIGRCVAKIVASRNDVELVAVNASGSEDMIQYNLRYDTVHGNNQDIKVEDGFITIGNDKAKLLAERDPSKLDFASYGADVVLECTGAFLTQESVQAYIDNGVKKVVMSAPAKDDTPTFVMGANENTYAGEAIVSNASCTTNGLAPVARVLDDAFGIEKLMLCGDNISLGRKMAKTSRATEKVVSYEINSDISKVIEYLKSKNYQIISLEITNSSQAIHNFQFSKEKPIALIIGDENFGVSEAILNQSDAVIHIDMFGQNSSMNVVQATNIAL